MLTAAQMAIEIGLHYEPRASQTSERELDQRRRVFWTAYSIEISLAYNLGRPPSISEEHITAKLPKTTTDSAPGSHHIRHRQIQSHIVSQVYGGASKPGTPANGPLVVAKLKRDLDEWRENLTALGNFDETSPYPLRQVFLELKVYFYGELTDLGTGSDCITAHLACFIGQARYVHDLLLNPSRDAYSPLEHI
jgi:hypothetical protein